VVSVGLSKCAAEPDAKAPEVAVLWLNLVAESFSKAKGLLERAKARTFEALVESWIARRGRGGRSQLLRAAATGHCDIPLITAQHATSWRLIGVERLPGFDDNV